MKNLNFILLLLLLFAGCQKQKKGGPLEAAYIYRNADEKSYLSQTFSPPIQPIYPWSHRYGKEYFLITKEFFRCKGASEHPLLVGKEILSDCDGLHSLPLKEGQEHIYPILIDLLNRIQEQIGKQICVTTGHRCVKHNRYADQSGYNASSKHMLGAEVDFYLIGGEDQQEEILKVIQQYYQNDPEVNQERDYTEFKRYTKGDVNVREAPWYNKEIFIKFYQRDEGRDFDNQHSYPYISLQVRYDRKRKEAVRFSWEEVEKLLHEN